MAQRAADGRSLDDLALLARDGSSEQRNRAWAALMPQVQEMARRIVRRTGGRRGSYVTEEFLDDSCFVVLTRLDKWQPKSPFKPWCYVVLRNLWRDRLRRQQVRHAQEYVEGISEAQASGQRSDGVDLQFSGNDIKTIDRWPDADRVFLLCVAGLWMKVPLAQWKQWCLALDLPATFPPDQLKDKDEPPQRVHWLSEHLGIRPNTIVQRWCRGQERLRALDMFRSGDQR